jgi:hypothetical protein
MKIDVDTIFYIILSIIILIVSGLGSRRKKRAEQAKNTMPSPEKAYGGPEERKMAQARRPAEDPFERLEQILSGQPRYETLEGESLEVIDDEEEAILDEEEAILDEEEEITEAPLFEEDDYDYDQPAESEDETETGKRLFGDLDEISRAVIYSEIFPRRYR